MTSHLPYSRRLYVPANQALRVRLDQTGNFVLVEIKGRTLTVSAMSEFLLENVINPDAKRKGKRNQ